MAQVGLTENDPNSYARPDLCAVDHVHLEVEVDFNRKVLAGFVDLTFTRKLSEAKSLVLDTQNLSINEVTHVSSSKKLPYDSSINDKIFGTKLEITLPDTEVGKSDVVRVHYETSPESSALQWLSPEQTAGGKHPYLYNHCEPIHARALLPCQDTPSVKAPYSASIRAPQELTVLMSAIREEAKDSGDGRTKVTHFNQKIPIPIYLIALVVGDLEKRQLGPRSHVWAEKEYVDLATIDFADTEKMLQVAEDLAGPYVWGIYDLLVLPPSFPYGGMENPCVTFVTPTLLAGDKSLASVIAHEISHSWTGNLVTNSTFEHFWLNEGFTMFLERKILARLCGKEHREFAASGGMKDLRYTVDTMGADNPLTSLVPCLKGVHPDDAFSTVPYEKGHTFLYYLEQKLGGPELFDPFLKSYVEHFKHQSINTNQWKDYLFEYFHDKVDVLKEVDWDTWLYAPGLPPVIPEYRSKLAEPCEVLCKKWADETADISTCACSDIENFCPVQLQEFLALLLEKKPLSSERFLQLTKLYNLEQMNNSEIRFCWLRLGLLAKCEDVIPHVIKFLEKIGRMKFVVPLFRDLYNWEEKRATAINLFERLQPRMMHVLKYTISKDLHVELT
ncbi:leukotriene A-4 hydrolase-like [Ornithodoros turicata]|uniref:leukotriene A-4 hydrolase-like n=1 Tax=Ornithodoros turicata TaxID=34597 RepID=UPI003138F135